MLAVRHVTSDAVVPIDVADIAGIRGTTGFVWVDLSSPTADEQAVLDHLDIHELTIEDMREDRHLPKLEAWGGELSLTVHGLRVDRAADEVETIELDVAMKEDLLVTYHDEPLASVGAIAERLDQVGPDGLDRPVLLLHRLLDTMNDVMVPFVDHFDRRLDVIEDDLMSTPTDATRQDLYRLQRDVIQLRRVVVPQAEVIRRLGRESVGLITEHDRALFRDVHDHLYRMAEMSDSYRQLLDSAMANYRSSADAELNDMLRVLTLMSALLLPISAIAGIYGTNFTYIPELGWRPGYFVMLGGFVALIATMLLWFRSRGWIGRRAEREADRRRSAMDAALEVPVLGTVLKIPVAGVRAVTRVGRRD